MHAARTAALIASGPTKQPVQGFTETRAADLYPVPLGGYDLDLAARLELILRADRAARAFDARVVQVRAGYAEELRRILIAASDGAFASDTQPLCRLNVFVIAKDGAVTTKGSAAAGDAQGWSSLLGRRARRAWREKRRGERSCSWAQWLLRRARWKWCWGRDGRGFCCTKQWGMGWKRTSIAREHRLLPD